MGKVRKNVDPKPILCNVSMELSSKRENITSTTCDIASITDIIAMLEDIGTN